MARNPENTSVRQQAFARLAELTGTGRKAAAEILMTELNIGSAYAMTLYQQHRTSMLKDGKMTATYQVREGSTGPSIVTSHVLTPAATDAKSPEEAVKAYVAGLQAKIDAAGKLDLTVPAPAATPAETPAEKPTKTSKSKAKAEKKSETSAEAPSAEATASTETSAEG